MFAGGSLSQETYCESELLHALHLLAYLSSSVILFELLWHHFYALNCRWQRIFNERTNHFQIFRCSILSAILSKILGQINGNLTKLSYEVRYLWFIVYTNYTVSQKTGALRLKWHNFVNSQHLPIIFGRDRPHSVRNWCGKFFKLA